MNSQSKSIADRSLNTRRAFLKSSTCGAMTNATFLSSLLHFKMASAVMANSFSVPSTGNYKALVCLLLRDGVDSTNFLAPYGSAPNDAQYNEYLTARGGAALKRNVAWDGFWPSTNFGYLHPVTDSPSMGGTGRVFGLHPRLVHMKSLYDAGHMTFVANCGALVEPIDNVAAFHQASKIKPLGLFSHPDQQRNWQTAVPQSRQQFRGWAGRMADLLTDSASASAQSNVYTAISLAGQSLLLTGNRIIPYSVASEGTVPLKGLDPSPFAFDRIYAGIQADLASQQYADLLERTIRDERVRARDTASAFQEAFTRMTLPSTTAHPFPNTIIGDNLKAVAKSIKVAQINAAPLHQSRQIFVVQNPGWDHHANLLSGQDYMVRDVDNALKAFYEFLKMEGLLDQVTTFTISDFGRTLSYNGSGTDHGWGGNTMVMGGAVNATPGNNRIWGTYPNRLTDTSPTGLDIGRGILIPQTSSDLYHAELCRWLGISNNSDLETVLPNIRNFYSAGASSHPIGFLRY